jgi:sulfoxide reductase heme-binding subunit YedZ
MSATPIASQPHDVALDTPASPDRARTRRMKSGPLFALLNLGASMVCAAILIGIHGMNVGALFEVTRILTRIGFLLFLAAFVAHPLHDLVGSKATGWMLANRRYLGLSFAAWHLPHWPILGAFMVMLGPSTFWKYFGSFAIPAGTVLIVITLLTTTSFNRAQKFLGKKLWSAIHTIGIFTIWAWFFRVYMLRHHNPKHAAPYVDVYLVLMVAAMVLRVAMTVRRRMKRASAAPA